MRTKRGTYDVWRKVVGVAAQYIEYDACKPFGKCFQLWTPLKMQAVFERGACSRMLPSVRPLDAGKLRARMGVRGPEPHHNSVLLARWKALVLPAPSRRLFCHTLLRSVYIPTTSDAIASLARRHDRSPVFFSPAHHRPDDARGLVGKCDSHQHARLSCEHLLKP